MRAALLLFIAAASCGPRPAEAPSPPASTAAPLGSTATGAPGSASTGTAAPNSAASRPSTATSTAPPPPTGGSVLVGDIPSSKKFDPKATVEGAKPAMLDCYNKARAGAPDISEKIKLLILVNAGGSVLKVDADPSGSPNSPTLVACLAEALKAVTFPKPGGMATVVVPLAFRP